MKIRVIILFLFCCCKLLKATDTVDVYHLLQSDTTSIDKRLVNYGLICDKYVKRKSDSSLFYINSYLNLAKANHKEGHVANSYFFRAKYHMISGRKTDVAENFFESLSIYEQQNDSFGIAKVTIALARLNHQEQNFVEAINYYKRTWDMYELLKNGHWLHHTLNELGALYYKQQEFEQARYYFYIALKNNIRFKQHQAAASSINNIALTYSNQNNFQKALNTFHLSLKISKLSHDDIMFANVLGNIGRLYKKVKENDSALHYISTSLQLETNLRNIENTMICYNDIAEIQLAKGQYDSAKSNLDTVFMLLEHHDHDELRLKALRNTSDYYRQKGDLVNAFLYLNRYITINDSIAEAERQQLAQATKLRLSLQKKDKEIKDLTATFNAQEQQMLRNEFTITLLSIISGLLVILAAMAISSAIKKSKINTQLEELNRERNTLMTMVSHDLKSPLASLQGMLSLFEAESNNLTSDQTKYINYMNEIIHNSNDMIKNVIDLGRVYEHNLKINLTEFKLHLTIEKIVAQFIPAGAKKNICLEFINNAANDLIKADESMMRRILENLISNAIKFSPLSSAVKIELFNPTPNSISLTVSDNGPGITEDEQQKLFQKFQRLSATPTGNETSSGLGLYIVKELVDKNKGQITYHNNPGGGSIFKVTLSLA